MFKLKVCGINNTENLKSILTLPVDMVGFIFYKQSKRNCTLTPNEVRAAFNQANMSTKKVGVFVNATIDEVLEVHEEYDLDFVQLHGEEGIFYCQELREHDVNIIKAFKVDEQFCFSNTTAYSFFCDYFLFDTKGKLPGGNGHAFDWKVLTKYKGKTPFLLGGGVNQFDVDRLRDLAYDQMSVVDINSSFEISPGHKNLDAVADFAYKLKRPEGFGKNRPYKKVING